MARALKIILLLLIPIFTGLIFSTPCFAQGGPPMVTDDPGTPGDGHWEINIAGILAHNSAQTIYQFPYFDVNYGWGEHLQLKIETGVTTLASSGSATKEGAGTFLAGMKYRFFDEETSGISISMYPQVQFHHFFSSNDPELTTPGNQYILPFEFSKSFGKWTLNPEVGYLYGTVVSNEIFYGMIFAYEDLKPWEPLFEVHVNSKLDGTGAETLLNVGARYTLSPHANLIAACGHTVTEPQGQITELDAYLGVQLEL